MCQVGARTDMRSTRTQEGINQAECMHVFFCPKARYEDSGQPDQFVKRFVFRDASVGLQSNPNSIVDRSPLSCPFPNLLSLVYCFLQQEIGFLYLLFSRFNQTRDWLTGV